jgi:copper oxidase (laccase) domain-containing protein
MSFRNLAYLGLDNCFFCGDVLPLLNGNTPRKKEEIICRIFKQLGTKARIVMPGIGHGDNIANINEIKDKVNPYRMPRIISGVDGLYWRADKDARCSVLVIPFADCPAVILVARKGLRIKSIAALHVGRKPLVKGIIEKALNIVQSNGEIYAAVYSGICPDCYEVGGDANNLEALEEFQKKFPVAEYPSLYSNNSKNVDLAGAIVLVLARGGVHKDNTKVIKICSYEDPTLYSHRRGDNGNNAICVVTP